MTKAPTNDASQVIEFDNQIDQIEKEKNMQYINSLEQLYLERGKLEGKQEGKFEAAQTMVKEFGISIKDATIKLKIPVQDLIEYLKNNESTRP